MLQGVTQGENYVVVILLENENYTDIIRSPAAPYLNALASDYALASNYFDVSTNHSLPNYLGLIAGNTFGSWSGCNQPPSGCLGWNPVSDATIVDRLEDSGFTWKAYMENMPSNCFGYDSGKYVVRHNPFVYFAKVIENSSECDKVTPAGSADFNLISDLSSPATASNFMWLTPNLCNDMHDCSVSAGDSYLSTLIPQILNSQVFRTRNAALFITWDEGRPASHIAAIWAGPTVKTNYTSNVRFDHYSFLRTVESIWKLPVLTENDNNANSMTAFFDARNQISITTTDPMVLQGVSFTGRVLQGVAPFRYAWTFGDGGSGNQSSVIHSYGRAGTYDVTLTTTDALNHTAISSAQVTVSPEPKLIVNDGPRPSNLLVATLMAAAGFMFGIAGISLARRVTAKKHRVKS